MPSIEKHTELSLKRTGKGYKELHEWMEGLGSGYKEKLARHDSRRIPEFSPIIEKQFGKDGLKEYLHHIKDDYNSHIVLIIRS